MHQFRNKDCRKFMKLCCFISRSISRWIWNICEKPWAKSWYNALKDLNSKSNLWYKNTTNEGPKIDVIASQFGLHQLIYEPTHLTRSTSSCTDLIFTSQPNLLMESGVHSSLHGNCFHQITSILIFIIHLQMNKTFGIIKRKTFRKYQKSNKCGSVEKAFSKWWCPQQSVFIQQNH